MAELATIARPYAEALFKAVGGDDAKSLADQLDSLGQVAAEPQLLAGAGAYAWYAKNALPRPVVAMQVNPALTAGQPAELSFRYAWKGATP